MYLIIVSQIEPFRNRLKKTAHKFFYNYNPLKVFCPLFTKDDFNVLKNLAEDKSIIISKPDKGRGVVIRKVAEYKQKVENILNDLTKFKPSKEDPFKLIQSLEDKLNRFLRTLISKGCLNPNLYDKLFSSAASPGIMYGLPKIHKKDAPIRPILSACNMHNFNLAKFLVDPLSLLSTNQYTVKNSFEFVKEITSLKNSNKLFMCSFDVENLFTNVPLQETIDICIDTLFYDDTVLIKGFNKQQFSKLMNLALKDTYFVFNGKMYQQIDGCSMGSPTGPVLANAFLCHHEQLWLDNCPSTFKPKYYRRYVDDTFVLFENQEQCNEFLTYLNSKHPNIKFTRELEVNSSISFLDILIKRDNNAFVTSLFRKKHFYRPWYKLFQLLSILFKNKCNQNINL